MNVNMYVKCCCVNLPLCVHVCVPSCVKAFQATDIKDYLDFPSGIFSSAAEKYY